MKKTYRVSEAEYYNLQDLSEYFMKNKEKASAYNPLLVNNIHQLANRITHVGYVVSGKQLGMIRKYKNMMLDIRFENIKKGMTLNASTT